MQIEELVSLLTEYHEDNPEIRGFRVERIGAIVFSDGTCQLVAHFGPGGEFVASTRAARGIPIDAEANYPGVARALEALRAHSIRWMFEDEVGKA